MDDRGSIYWLRKPEDASVLSKSSSIVTPRRNMLIDFQMLARGQVCAKNLDVYVRVKPGETRTDESVLSLENNSITLHPPQTSFAAKARGGLRAHKFSFTKVFGPAVSQKGLFEESVLKLTDHFLHGQNTLIFTYGATSAGKTFTMHGSASDLGIIPRSLDVIFNSIGGKQMENILLKPQCLDDIIRLSPENAALEELERSCVLNGTDSDITGSKESLQGATSLLNFTEWKQREKITTKVGLEDDTTHYSIWVSFAEIYNEQVFDLLEKYQRNRKPEPLRIAEDRKGKTYVKGLKEVCVRSADEAYQVILFGKENLHFATTKLNHNSSRSHCVFTIKVIRTTDPKDPKEASLSLMSFCDLAGMERTGKTESRGDRLKEAGNINTSLLVLGRCLDAIRQNRAIVPFRESKLTRLLQVYFTGQSHPAMMLNVSQSALLFDETLSVLKFGAKAEEIILAPKPDTSVVDVSVSSMFAPPMKPTKFMQFVRKSFSRLSARPLVREVPSVAYDEEKEVLLQRLQEAETELAKLAEDKLNMEVELRHEICAEWEQIVQQLNLSWQTQLADTRAMYEKSCENKLNVLAEYANKCLKRKRGEEASEELNTLLSAKDGTIQELKADKVFLEQQLAQLQQNLQTSEARQAELQCQLTRLRFERAVVAEAKTTFIGDDLSDEDLDSGVESEQLSKVRQKLATNQEMLQEAAVEFQAKCLKVAQLEDELEKNALKLAQISEQNTDLKEKNERIEYLLRDACDRLEAKDAEISSLEEKMSASGGEISKLNSQLRLLKRTIRELEAKNTPAASWEEKYSKLSADHDRLVQKLSSMENSMADSSDNEKLNKELLRLEIRLREAEENVQLLQKQKKQAEDDHHMEKETLMDELDHLKRDLELSSAEKAQADQDNLPPVITALEETRRRPSSMRQRNVRDIQPSDNLNERIDAGAATTTAGFSEPVQRGEVAVGIPVAGPSWEENPQYTLPAGNPAVPLQDTPQLAGRPASHPVIPEEPVSISEPLQHGQVVVAGNATSPQPDGRPASQPDNPGDPVPTNDAHDAVPTPISADPVLDGAIAGTIGQEASAVAPGPPSVNQGTARVLIQGSMLNLNYRERRRLARLHLQEAWRQRHSGR